MIRSGQSKATVKGVQHDSKIDSVCLPFLLLLINVVVEVLGFLTVMEGVLMSSYLRFERQGVMYPFCQCESRQLCCGSGTGSGSNCFLMT